MKFQENRLIYIRRFAFVLFIVITAVFQNAKGSLLSISGVHAVLLVPLTVCVAMHEKSVAALLLGVFSGVLLDMFSSAPDGFYALFLATVAFVCSLLVTFEMRNNIMTALLLSFCACFAQTLLYWLLFFFAKGYDSAVYVYFRFYFSSAVYSSLFTFIYYYAVQKICRLTLPERKRKIY